MIQSLPQLDHEIVQTIKDRTMAEALVEKMFVTAVGIEAWMQNATRRGWRGIVLMLARIARKRT